MIAVLGRSLTAVIASFASLRATLAALVLAGESIEGWNLLARLRCDDAQGFYMSPPIDAEALVRWIRAHQQSQQRAGSYADSA